MVGQIRANNKYQPVRSSPVACVGCHVYACEPGEVDGLLEAFGKLRDIVPFRDILIPGAS